MGTFYTILGLLLALSGLASAISAFTSKEDSNTKMGFAFSVLFLAGALACLALKVGWF